MSEITKKLKKIEKYCWKSKVWQEFKELWDKFINNSIWRIELCTLFDKLINAKDTNTKLKWL